MSHPSKSQQRFPFRALVHVQRNYRKLPPITQTIRPIEENGSLQSPLSIINVDIKCETPQLNENNFWDKLHEHIASQTLEYNNDHGNQKTPNKIVRIFVSSTFTDFFNEREVLIKKVFPALRDEMEPAGIQIIDCDLRWGVPKDSTTEQTILTCLEELDRCFEDNGQPFFIGLVSDKYGWVPKLNELPKNIIERYRWIDEASITLMEFIHGAFRTHNPNAFFLIRKSENILSNLPDKYKDKFRDKDEFNQSQIQELKNQLPKIFPPEQIFHYDCFYNGLDSSTGRERVKIDGLHEFEEQARKFLIQAIQKWYPANFTNTSSLDTEQKQMNTFLLNKTQYFVDRPNEFSFLFKYITGDHKDLTLISPTDTTSENAQPFLALTGRSGDGKSILLGKFVLNIEEKFQNKFFLFYYFLDGAFHANASHFMLTSLKQKLDKYLEENNLISPKTGERLKITDDTFLSDAIGLLPIPLLIIVDGLDKGDIHHNRKYKEEFPFSNLNELMTDHTYIIISCETNLKLYETILNHIHYNLQLQPLTIEQL
ncbi:unnamed protein product [Rotaria sordida]|uniref:DUF4062 domain-containing protein n=2 Tax=Rotaria sordida TaxID=392033 RepID=A0A814A9N5_9BILA|nr:unnamed protein product [Rotaria sordida]CAF0911155.1 unnamed protein product [Rotaria sordida]CAF0915402.1 unnamed protein product [Rotaria sordida]